MAGERSLPGEFDWLRDLKPNRGGRGWQRGCISAPCDRRQSLYRDARSERELLADRVCTWDFPTWGSGGGRKCECLCRRQSPWRDREAYAADKRELHRGPGKLWIYRAIRVSRG